MDSEHSHIFETPPQRQILVGHFRPNPNSLTKQVWDHDHTIYWRLEKDHDLEFVSNEQKIIARAILQFSILTKLRIRQKRRSTAEAEIMVNITDDKYFINNDRVLAFAYGPATHIGSDITFNPHVIWTDNGEPWDADTYYKNTGKRLENPKSYAKTYDFQHTFTHEAGHAVGMPHSTNASSDRNNVMWPSYNKQRVLQPGDKNYLWTLYPKRNLPSRLISSIERIILRRN